jgi:hypothetical protein
MCFHIMLGIGISFGIGTCIASGIGIVMVVTRGIVSWELQEDWKRLREL